MPENCPVLVEELLAALHFNGDEIVADAHGKESNLHTALFKTFNITQPQSSLLQAAAERAKNSSLLELLAPAQKAALDKWLYGRDIVDVLRHVPGRNLLRLSSPTCCANCSHGFIRFPHRPKRIRARSTSPWRRCGIIAMGANERALLPAGWQIEWR